MDARAREDKFHYRMWVHGRTARYRICGRYYLLTPGPALADLFHLAGIPNLAPRYNIAPTQPVLAIGPDRDGRPATAKRDDDKGVVVVDGVESPPFDRVLDAPVVFDDAITCAYWPPAART